MYVKYIYTTLGLPQLTISFSVSSDFKECSDFKELMQQLACPESKPVSLLLDLFLVQDDFFDTRKTAGPPINTITTPINTENKIVTVVKK